MGPIKHLFASNLKRAVKTAQTIAEAQSRVEGVENVPEVVQALELREKDFGSEEGKRFGSRGKQEALDASKASDWIAPESQELMKKRIERFVDAFFVPTVSQAASDAGACSVVIVAHGIILNVLLRSLLARFGSEEILKLTKPGDASGRSEWLASWSNTGYLEAELRVSTPAAAPALIDPAPENKPTDDFAIVESSIVQGRDSKAAPSEDVIAVVQPEAASPSATSPVPVSDSDIHLILKTVNCVEHLQGLKKTRGGIGSAGHDEKQKTMESFFSRPAKKPRRDEGDI